MHVLIDGKDFFNGAEFDANEVLSVVKEKLNIVCSLLIDNHCPYGSIFEFDYHPDDMRDLFLEYCYDGAELSIGDTDGNWVHIEYRASL